ncbi:MAG TPA: YeeE/YedE thiosulfate transporter family protein [Methanoregulaceae archaeon]|nr:YeeE/YedE thiosulfate transporter family protein [Methanoregulaceae archaeon]
MSDMTGSDKGMPTGIDKYAKTPLFVGFLIGVLAAFVQGLLISAGGPEAYGFCVACHTRDLVDWGVNGIAGTKLAIAPISANSVLPVLTIIGVLIGAFISARYYREFRLKSANPLDIVKFCAGGFIFMVFALFMAGCPYRIALNIGYGNFIAFIGVIAIVVGVFAGTMIAMHITQKEG